MEKIKAPKTSFSGLYILKIHQKSNIKHQTSPSNLSHLRFQRRARFGLTMISLITAVSGVSMAYLIVSAINSGVIPAAK
jgi:hypothetical protein